MVPQELIQHLSLIGGMSAFFIYSIKDGSIKGMVLLLSDWWKKQQI